MDTGDQSPAKGWFDFENQSDQNLTLFIEPYATAHEIPPYSRFKIYFFESEGERPQVIYRQNMIVICATYIAVYQDDVEIYDSRD